MYSNRENVNILTSLLVAFGVKRVVVCPGSRNAPLVHNFSVCPEITCYPVTDERSAGSIALGLRQKLQRPVAVCVTSGSALLNVLPAVAEATYQRQGIIVISADRPQQWIDQLDGQTLPQQNALGTFVAKSVQLPEPHDDEERWYCNRLINEALLANLSAGLPSVHINVPITEPFFSFDQPNLPEERKVSYADWSNDYAKEWVLRQVLDAKHLLVVIGQLPQDSLPDDYLSELMAVVPVLYEPLSADGVSQCFTDQMLFAMGELDDAYAPDCILYLGGHTVSKRLRQKLRKWGKDAKVVQVDEKGELHDVTMNADVIIKGKAYDVICDINGYMESTAARERYLGKWEELAGEVREIHDRYLPEFSSMLAVKMLEESVKPDYDTVCYANSMSVRLASVYANHYCYCNRGVNGIEGSLSNAVGLSLAVQELSDDYEMGNVYCVIGDLSFFYDENALWQQYINGNFRILLLNNGQGAIFRNLKGLEQSPVRDTFVAAAHQTSAEGICKQFGIKYIKATDEVTLARGITDLTCCNSTKPVLLEVQTTAQQDEQAFNKYYSELKNII